MKIKTLKQLERQLEKHRIALSICMIGFDGKFRVDIVGIDLGVFQYEMTWRQNTRGVYYFHYEDWIYTEKELVELIIKSLPDWCFT